MKTTRLIDDPWASDDGTQRGVPRSIQQLSEPLALPSSFSRAREINANASGARIPRVSDGAHRDRLAQRRNELTQTLDELAQVVATHSLDTAEHISS
jgi:hypothetical protein